MSEVALTDPNKVQSTQQSPLDFCVVLHPRWRLGLPPLLPGTDTDTDIESDGAQARLISACN